MEINFTKYQATGNDFILIDNRKNIFPKFDNEFIKNICDRRFGIGADGLILLESKDGFDFDMIYYNCDGNIGSMCGNGARSIVHFANYINIKPKKDRFIFINNSNIYSGIINNKESLITISYDSKVMFEVNDNNYIDVGSPHYVKFYQDIDKLDIKSIAIEINKLYKDRTNVNFIKIIKDAIAIRTYERGVENETLSCGTGAIASSIIFDFNSNKNNGNKSIKIKALGGDLFVSLFRNNNTYSKIKLEGNVKFVFIGKIKYTPQKG